MIMKLLNFLAICSLPATAILMAGCDEIAPDDRYVKMDYFEPARNVLIEDFTGQRCVNCPTVHDDIDKLHELYGDAVIPVAIHGGAPSFEYKTNNTRYIGLADSEGAYYGDKLTKKDERPVIVIDRGSTEHSPTEGEWLSAVRNALSRLSDYEISIDARMSDDDSTIEITTEVENNGALASADARLQVWILEDNIVAIQSMPDGSSNNEYVHNHVFRAAANGLDGEEISIAADSRQTFTCSTPRVAGERENWNPDNLSVVAFVYTPSGVQNVAKVKVVN